MLPQVSCVVCVLNGERFLSRALSSIRAQSFRDYELIVVDGRSSDRSREIAGSFEPDCLLSQSGSGIADAYNCGVAHARGEFVAFLSADDEWTSEKLETQCSYMREFAHIDYSLTRAKYVLEDGHTAPRGFRQELLQGAHTGAMETLMARRRVFDRVGPFDTQYKTAEDIDWMVRAHDAGAMSVVMTDVLLIKHIHNNNLSLTEATNNASILNALHASLQRKRTTGAA